MTDRSEVIVVHGLWFGSWAMAGLARKLQAEELAVRRFSYSSTAGNLAEHAAKLLEFARATPANRLHFACHSLGGLVTLRMLSEPCNLPPGRVVLLGTPLAGSQVARRAGRIPGAKILMGDIREALEHGYLRLPASRETGVIAGSRALGLGMLVGGPEKPADGTVGVSETRVKGLKDHLVLPVGHTGLLYSREAARQAACFLKTGRFEPAPAW